MYRIRAIAAVMASAAVITAGATVAPAGAATPHWSKTQCQTWARGFQKRNPHATKTRKAQGNKVLRGHGCAQRIK